MSKTKTSGATIALNLATPPKGGDLSVVTSLEEDAHYLRVTLDKSENFKVAAGERLRDLLINKFANNRNALRDWYEDNVVQGKAHRAWSTVAVYLSVVNKYGDNAEEVFAERDQRERDTARVTQATIREQARAYRNELVDGKNANENNGVFRQPARSIKTEYDKRKEWLSDMNVLWFKGSREWQDKWLQDRRLERGRGSD
jgi:hypothetical protein